MIWNLRARFLARAGGGFRAAFSPEMEFWGHQDYPWLVPGLVAQGFLASGAESRLVPALFAAAFGVLAVAIPSLALARLRGAHWGLLAAFALLTTPCFVIFVVHQESDVPLSVYLASAAALLLLAEQRAYPFRLLVLAGFAAGLAAWTKNEGSLYAACLAAALLFRSRKWSVVGSFLAGVAPVAVLVLGFKLGFAPPTDLWRFSSARSVLSHAADPARWARLVWLTLRRVFFFQDHALWVAAELVLLIGWVRKLPGSVPGTALFLACAAYAPLYVLQPHPLDWLYRYSVERIFIQLWPAAILATLFPLASDAERRATPQPTPTYSVRCG
jgi:4-amino-4-deoxy-L-arabinose transferase-like glycosyltransferase